jgi:hypothetical protein
MIRAFWNIRGLNEIGRTKCLADFMNTNKLDFVGIQEIKKASFENRELFAIHSKLAWNYISCRGILVGLRALELELISWESYKYCVVAVLKLVKITSYGDCCWYMALLMKNLS